MPTELMTHEPTRAEWSKEQVDLVKRTICKGASDDELQLFLRLCRRTELDPFARQVYAIKRWDGREQREVMTFQLSIDGLRLIASRTGKYEGSEGPFWCGEDGEWRDVWLADMPPAACKIGVWRSGCRAPFWAVAKFSEYVQTDKRGDSLGLWRKMPAGMLAKACEALALRRAFPQELSGLHSTEEMEQADPAEVAAPPAEPTWSIKDMVASFQQLKERLGAGNEHLYYEILRQHGVAHSNEFRDPKLARAAYRQVLSRVMTVEDAPAEPGDAA